MCCSVFNIVLDKQTLQIHFLLTISILYCFFLEMGLYTTIQGHRWSSLEGSHSCLSLCKIIYQFFSIKVFSKLVTIRKDMTGLYL